MVGKQFHCSNGKIKEIDLALPINALNSKDIIALELRGRLNVGGIYKYLEMGHRDFHNRIISLKKNCTYDIVVVVIPIRQKDFK